MFYLREVRPADAEPQPADGGHPHAPAGVDRLVAVRRPVLAVDHHGARRREPLLCVPDLADHRLGAHGGGPPLPADDERDDEHQERAEHGGDGEDHRPRHLDAGLAVEEEQRADEQRPRRRRRRAARSAGRPRR
jgi:hypothetical protein